jgi:hypothetical protein
MGSSYGQGALAPTEESREQSGKRVVDVDDDDEHNVDDRGERHGGMLTVMGHGCPIGTRRRRRLAGVLCFSEVYLDAGGGINAGVGFWRDRALL